MMVVYGYGDWLIAIGGDGAIVWLLGIEVLIDLTPANHHVEGCGESTANTDPNPFNEILVLL